MPTLATRRIAYINTLNIWQKKSYKHGNVLQQMSNSGNVINVSGASLAKKISV